MRARLLLVTVLALAPPALADAVRVSLKGRALVGQGVPELELHILEPIAGYEVKLRRSDGESLHVRGGGAPGVTRKVPLRQPEGTFRYEGELVVRFPDAQTASMPLSFEAQLAGPPRLTVRPEDLDVEARQLRFRLSQPAARARVVVLMDTGKKAFDGEVAFGGEPAGTPLRVSWPAAQGRVMRISLKVFDTSDYFTAVDLYPWRVDVPHEEVHFATGSARIEPTEHPKLDKSAALVADAVRRYGHLAPLRLFILGHTDTVGTVADNRRLSVERARAIATYLRRRGLTLPVLYEGFGEEMLRVGTPDETDELANRRAEYILAVEEPRLGAPPFPPRWRRP